MCLCGSISSNTCQFVYVTMSLSVLYCAYDLRARVCISVYIKYKWVCMCDILSFVSRHRHWMLPSPLQGRWQKECKKEDGRMKDRKHADSLKNSSTQFIAFTLHLLPWLHSFFSLSGSPPWLPNVGKEYTVGSVKQFKISLWVSPHLSLLPLSIMPTVIHVFLPIFLHFSHPFSSSCFCYYPSASPLALSLIVLFTYPSNAIFISTSSIFSLPPLYHFWFTCLHSSPPFLSLPSTMLLIIACSLFFFSIVCPSPLFPSVSSFPPSSCSHFYPMSLYLYPSHKSSCFLLSLSLSFSLLWALPVPFRQFILLLTLDMLNSRLTYYTPGCPSLNEASPLQHAVSFLPLSFS